MNSLHSDIQQVSDTFYVLQGAELVIQIAQPTVFEPQEQKAVKLSEQKISYIPTNAADDRPLQFMTKVRQNEILRTSLQRICQIIYGEGIQYGTLEQQTNGTKVFVESDNVDVANFFAANNIQAQVEEIINDLVYLGHSYIFLGLNNATGKALKIVQFEHLEAYFSRLSEMTPDGKIETHLYAADWSKKPIANLTTKPLLDTKTPYRDLMQRTGKMPVLKGKKVVTKDDMQRGFVVMIRTPQPGNQYYPEPTYASAFNSKWYDVASQIPQYKLAVMANQVNIDYHIELHPDFFNEIYKKEGITTKDAQNQRKIDEINKLNELFKGYKNAGKNIVSMFYASPDGKAELSLMKIKKIEKANPADTVVDSQESASFLYTAVGLHPALVGVLPGNSANNLSNGSEKRELSNMYQLWYKSYRDAITRTLDIVKNYNGWDSSIVFKFPYLVQTTLNEGTEAKSTI